MYIVAPGTLCPPPISPLVLFETPDGAYLAPLLPDAVLSPKFCAVPPDAMVIKSIVFTSPGEYPHANTALVLLARVLLMHL